jgi:hypothetical protein
MITLTRVAMSLPACILLLLAAILLGTSVTSTAAAADPASIEASAAPRSTFEGVLGIHSKFLYRYNIVGQAERQHLALFSGEDGGEDQLKNIPVGSTIEVRGRLGTRFHAGGAAENPSPFPRCWFVYMDVEQVKVIRGPDPLPKSDRSTPAPVSFPPGTMLPGAPLAPVSRPNL